MMARSHISRARAHDPSGDEEEIPSGQPSDSTPEDLEQSTDASSDDDPQADEEMPDEMRTISFGALAEAQDSLSSQHDTQTGHDRQRQPGSYQLAALRARLAELRGVKINPSKDPGAASRSPRDWKDTQRSSKHAPTELSSRRAVSRVRNVIDLSSNPHHIRDPRFSSVSTAQATIDSARLSKNYSFLTDYRDSELTDLKNNLNALKARAKKRKSRQLLQTEADEIERLKPQINSIVNKKKSETAKEREREVVRRHRKEEREAIKQGKKPYFLKRGEAKKTAEQERWDSLKGREKKKLKERREKKRSQKEKGVMGLPEG